MARRPNILFITADQWRGDCLGVAGNQVIQTPHIDALAADGVYFSRHYAATAPCGPSRASLLTGLYPHNHRAVLNGTPLDGRLTNVALELRAAGYLPTLFGYTDTTPDPREYAADDPVLRSYEGVLKGFRAGALLGEDGAAWLRDLRRLGYDVPELGLAIYDADPTVDVPPGRQPTFAPTRFAKEHSETAWLTNRVLDHVTLSGEVPFCLHVSYLRPHPPFIAPSGFHDLYHPDDMPAPSRAPSPDAEASQHPFLAAALARVKQSTFFNHGDGLAADLDDAAVRQIRATYYGLITEVDHHIGRLVDGLRQAGLYDDTVIVLTADHGEQLGDHFLFGKLGYFDQSFHIPLIVKPAAGEGVGGGRVDAFTEAVDVMPTLLEAAGRQVPGQCDGSSLGPFLTGRTPADWRRSVHWEYDFRDPITRTAERQFGLTSEQCNLTVQRDGRYKYVHFAGLPPLLFDLQADGGEFHNLADDAASGPILLRCAQDMLSWRMTHEFGALHNLMATPDGMIDGSVNYD